MTSSITRPVLRYHGGKFRISHWVISHLPPHRYYLEPYAGAASVLMQKPRVTNEIINDLDGEIVALFRVLRDPAQACELETLLRLTPYARTEFEHGYLLAPDPIECARRLIVRAFMGHGSDAATRATKTGFRWRRLEHGQLPSREWATYPNAIPQFVERLQGVLIENRPAVDVIQQHDDERLLIYCDPPYLTSTRTNCIDGRKSYRHEMTDQDHRELAECLRSAKGMVVLSGYPSPLYDALYGDWQRYERKALADGAKVRTECLWLSPRATERVQHGLDL